MDLTLNLTHDCNLACRYCYAGAPRRAVMPWSIVTAALDLAFEATPAGSVLQLSFFGGEPLLEWVLLQRCVDEAETRAAASGARFLPTITTNATLLTADRARWLANHRVDVALSLDGNRAGHEATRPTRAGASSFDAALAGLRAMLPLQPGLEVIDVVDPANVEHVADGIRFLLDEGVQEIGLSPNFTGDWTAARRDEWSRQYAAIADLVIAEFRRDRSPAINFVDGKIITGLRGEFPCADRCSFGEQEIAVAPSGCIYPCERLVGEDLGAHAIGHVNSGIDHQALGAELRQRGNTDASCLTCTLRPRCMNWCGCINLATTGATDHVSPLLCFHEQLCIDEADRVAEVLWGEKNSAFLKKFYR